MLTSSFFLFLNRKKKIHNFLPGGHARGLFSVLGSNPIAPPLALIIKDFLRNMLMLCKLYFSKLLLVCCVLFVRFVCILYAACLPDEWTGSSNNNRASIHTHTHRRLDQLNIFIFTPSNGACGGFTWLSHRPSGAGNSFFFLFHFFLYLSLSFSWSFSTILYADNFTTLSGTVDERSTNEFYC